MADLVARVASRFCKYHLITSTSKLYGTIPRNSRSSMTLRRELYNSPVRYSTSERPKSPNHPYADFAKLAYRKNTWLLKKKFPGMISQLDHLRIDDLNDARALVGHLHPPERELLKAALKEQQKTDFKHKGDELAFNELRQLFVVNMMPFVGFGILDNMIMILAGEYIDQQLGTLLCISTMAAAALGNIISDVAGVGLAHYVEALVLKVGIKHPSLSSDQLESSKARYTVNASRAVGLVIGCLIGMFPLIFFDAKELEETKEKECDI